ncbi:hypothetical protein [Oceanicella sp. SM1341]|uniref:hypothetical protein n=1 Tax=Oceanicella sp. SM1341 TaxID=1548889 RepID=UPI000E4B1CD4|nr:hypothetical protein [Oceanicella sp. SM1341]
MPRLAAPALACLLAFAGAPALPQSPADLNDYPTETRADYVFACMAANGQTRDMLRRCSCSIDVIATILPFTDYEEAETVLSVTQMGGERVAALRNSAEAKGVVADLRRAQAEAEVRCF